MLLFNYNIILKKTISVKTAYKNTKYFFKMKPDGDCNQTRNRRRDTFSDIVYETRGGGSICEYSWILNVATCATSLCTLIVVIVFFIWVATSGVNLNS